MTNDRVAELLREIEQLRYALQGRTLSCGYCNQQAKDTKKLLDRIREHCEREKHMQLERVAIEDKHRALYNQHENLIDVVQRFISAELSYRIREGRPRSATVDAMRDLSVRAYNWATTFAEMQKCVDPE